MSQNNSNQRCYDCGEAGCTCSIRASSRTYNKVNHALSRKFGVPLPNTGHPSQDFDLILGDL